MSDYSDFMLSTIPQLKRAWKTPEVYAIVLESSKGSLLHLGIHYSLDEAIAAATPALVASNPHLPSDIIGVEMWASLRGEDVVKTMLDNNPDLLPKPNQPSRTIADIPLPARMNSVVPIKDQITRVKDYKNKLMKDLIEQADPKTVESTVGVLSKNERKLIMDAIQKKMHPHGEQKNN